MHSVMAVYKDFRTARGVVRELVEYGFEPEQISIAAATRGSTFQFLNGPSQSGLIYARGLPAEDGTGARLGVGIGSAAGMTAALAGGLPAGLAAATLAVLPWLGIGGLAGGLVGWILAVLLGFAIPEKEVENYAENVRQGGVLVTVKIDPNNTSMLRAILSRYQPHDINDQPPEWAQPGWMGFW